MRPGLSPGEARFLTQALEQTVDVARRVETNPHLLDAADDETYLVRVTEGNGRLVWRDEHMYGRLAALKDIMGVELFYEPVLPAMEEVKDQLLAYLQR